MTKPATLLEAATGDSFPKSGDLTRLERGIYNVEVVGDLGSATVTIEQSLDDDATNNGSWKTMDAMVFTEAGIKMEVMRGGVNVRATCDAAPSADIKVWAEIASS